MSIMGVSEKCKNFNFMIGLDIFLRKRTISNDERHNDVVFFYIIIIITIIIIII